MRATAAEIEFFRENGWSKIDNVASAEILERLNQTFDELFGPTLGDLRDIPDEWKVSAHRRDPALRKQNEMISDLRNKHPVFRDFLLSSSLAELAQSLMGPWGIHGVRLLEDRAIVKPANVKDARPQVWHQDFPTLPIDRGGALVLWIPLQDVTADMGALSFVSGSHKLGPLGLVDYQRDDGMIQIRPDLQDVLKEAEKHPVELRAGSATVHDTLTLHYSGPNVSNKERRALSTLYIPAHTIYTGTPYGGYLPDGLQVNEPFDHEYFPVFSKG